ncbi:hypothetical protein IFO70_27335 [Phormidium tenue FACHB-886]|nr:hypothetical protein [Phormidium tenue FACHB-886]
MTSDREQYETILQGFVGRVFRRTIVCNSIKLRFEETVDTANLSYIWVDPPWSFMRHHQPITASDLCPHYEAADYTSRFRKWCSLFSALDQSVLTGYEFASSESLNLFFSNSYLLYIPKIEAELESDALWYSHWYASQNKNVGVDVNVS